MKAIASLVLFISFLLLLNCTKEKSFENGNSSGRRNDTLPIYNRPDDSIPLPTKFSEGEWSFIEGNHFFSGKIDTAYIQRTSSWEAVSFWGATNTSNRVFDTVHQVALVFDTLFTSNKTNISSASAVLYLQAQGLGGVQWLYVPADLIPSKVKYIVDSYDNTIKEYRGRFFGHALNSLTSDTCYISSGRFRLKF